MMLPAHNVHVVGLVLSPRHSHLGHVGIELCQTQGHGFLVWKIVYLIAFVKLQLINGGNGKWACQLVDEV
ncbi:hypothetical protein D3C79_1030620 [compost metagenome]